MIDYAALTPKEDMQMPNQRKDGKKLLAAWIEEADKDEFQEIAESIGMTATDLITQLVREEIKRNRKMKGIEK